MTFQKEAKNLDIFRRFDLTLTALFIALQMLKIVKIFWMMDTGLKVGWFLDPWSDPFVPILNRTKFE